MEIKLTFHHRGIAVGGDHAAVDGRAGEVELEGSLVTIDLRAEAGAVEHTAAVPGLHLKLVIANLLDEESNGKAVAVKALKATGAEAVIVAAVARETVAGMTMTRVAGLMARMTVARLIGHVAIVLPAVARLAGTVFIARIRAGILLIARKSRRSETDEENRK